MSKPAALTSEDRAAIAELLLVSAVYLRYLADRGPRMSPQLCDTLLRHADTADRLREKFNA